MSTTDNWLDSALTCCERAECAWLSTLAACASTERPCETTDRPCDTVSTRTLRPAACAESACDTTLAACVTTLAALLAAFAVDCAFDTARLTTSSRALSTDAACDTAS